ncbi:hypothetical protein ACFQVA_00390 [Actinomadura keratinilytica]
MAPAALSVLVALVALMCVVGHAQRDSSPPGRPPSSSLSSPRPSKRPTGRPRRAARRSSPLGPRSATTALPTRPAALRRRLPRGQQTRPRAARRSGAMSCWAPPQPLLAVLSVGLPAEAALRRRSSQTECAVPASA